MSKYKMPFNQYKQCQKMTKNEFTRWVETIADETYKDGYREAMKDVPDGCIVLNPEEVVVIDWNDEEFYDMLLSVKGVGKALADKIVDKIYKYYDNHQNDA